MLEGRTREMDPGRGPFGRAPCIGGYTAWPFDTVCCLVCQWLGDNREAMEETHCHTGFDLLPPFSKVPIGLSTTCLHRRYQHHLGISSYSIFTTHHPRKADMLLVPEALGMANTLLRNTTQTGALGIPPDFCNRARDTLIAARCLRTVPPAEF